MDKKYTLFGIILLIVGGYFLYQNNLEIEAQRQAYLEEQALLAEQQLEEVEVVSADELEQPSINAIGATTKSIASTTSTTPSIASEVEQIEQAAISTIAENTVVLENELIAVTFTSKGGAIKSVAFKDYAAVQGSPEPYIFNKNENTQAALSISIGKPTSKDSTYAPDYAISQQTGQSITFVREENGLLIERTYALSDEHTGPIPYTIEHSTRFLNKSGKALNVETLYVNLGTAAPDAADSMGINLSAGWWNGEDYEYKKASKFTGGGFLMFKSSPKPFIEQEEQIVWASVKNQFFASVFTPSEPGIGVFMKAVNLDKDPETGKIQKGVTSNVGLDVGIIEAAGSKTISADYYVGPKEYKRLVEIGNREEKIMEFGFVSPLSVFLLKVLYLVQGIVVNYGLSIIIVTILLRLAMWPLTAKAARSAKNMQKLQAPMAELREKYKDNPQKLNKEMMLMWKEHKVNPMAGCLPIFFQLPIFMAFYYMLQSSSELRFEHFLWIKDLSLPDTVAVIGGIPLNILPILMCVSTFYQMKLQPTPTVDNAQVKMMRFMPVIFLFICYGFSSGLVLYWTCSNIFGILQQIYTNHHKYKDEEEVEVIAPQKSQEPLKKRGKRRS